jgi:hypothetical protein
MFGTKWLWVHFLRECQPQSREARAQRVDHGRGPHPPTYTIDGIALRLVQVNFKARDDSALGRFWAQVCGWGVSSEGPV